MPALDPSALQNQGYSRKFVFIRGCKSVVNSAPGPSILQDEGYRRLTQAP